MLALVLFVPVPLTLVPLTLVSVTPVSVTPVSVTPVPLAPVPLTPMPLTPVPLAPTPPTVLLAALAAFALAICKVCGHRIGQVNVFFLLFLDNLRWYTIISRMLWRDPLPLVILRTLLVAGHMVNTQRSAQHLSTIQIIDSKYSRPLILVHEESKTPMPVRNSLPAALALAWLFSCAGEIYIDNLAILRKDSNHVALREIERQAANEYIGRVAVLIMP